MAAVVAVAFVLLAGCTHKPEQNSGQVPPANDGSGASVATAVTLKQDDSVGTYFADSKGMALYIFTKDTATSSVCSGQCLVNWPIFYAENLTLPEGLDSADFGEIVHPNGEKMTTYKGWPLYYYIGDRNPGDINGEGVGDVWYVAKDDYKLVFSTDKIGDYLVDEAGMTLYYFTRDTKDKSVCTGQCLVNWPAFYDEDQAVPTTVTGASDFGTITREDGTPQTTYKGWPLYYYINDRVRGDKTGQGVNDVWYVVDPKALASAPAGGN